MVKNELFNPADPRNVETDRVKDDIGFVVAETLLKELSDEKKETHEHLSMNNGMHSWNRTSEAENEAGKGLFANNNASESSFGGLTNQVETYSMTSVTNTGGRAIERQNGDFNIVIDSLYAKNKHKGKNCTLHFILLLLKLFVEVNATKILALMHRLTAPMHDFLLILIRNIRPHQSREDSIQIEAQRDKNEGKMN